MGRLHLFLGFSRRNDLHCSSLAPSLQTGTGPIESLCALLSMACQACTNMVHQHPVTIRSLCVGLFNYPQDICIHCNRRDTEIKIALPVKKKKKKKKDRKKKRLKTQICSIRDNHKIVIPHSSVAPNPNIILSSIPLGPHTLS